MSKKYIHLKGARQNNLKGWDLRIPLHELVVVTGVSGSGKSSLAFDTVYAEGQRRYVETFSPYARQFLERMDKPLADRIEGIPPAIAIDQTNPVRTSRSTVGTMTELNDHLKLLFARAAQLYCRGCGRPVHRDTPETIYKDLAKACARAGTSLAGRATDTPRMLITFPVAVPENFSAEEVANVLQRQGYTRFLRRTRRRLEVIQDRVTFAPRRRRRIMDDLETALRHGHGIVHIHWVDAQDRPQATTRFSSELHCPDCDFEYDDPSPNTFSFNSPMGACSTCRGFGRTMGIDYGLVVPDETKSLEAGAVKPWQSESFHECQEDLLRYARPDGIPTDRPWAKLTARQRRWVLEGAEEWNGWNSGHWYGVKEFFNWLESKSYKMHIRVLLSKYRAYHLCPECGGARLKPDALLWRLGGKRDARRTAGTRQRGGPLPGLNVHEVMLLPIDQCHRFFDQLRLPKPIDEATELLLEEIRSRLRYLVDVGLGYLTLNRESGTLSGGERAADGGGAREQTDSVPQKADPAQKGPAQDVHPVPDLAGGRHHHVAVRSPRPKHARGHRHRCANRIAGVRRRRRHGEVFRLGADGLRPDDHRQASQPPDHGVRAQLREPGEEGTEGDQGADHRPRGRDGPGLRTAPAFRGAQRHASQKPAVVSALNTLQSRIHHSPARKNRHIDSKGEATA